MHVDLKQRLESFFGFPISNISSVKGGDINLAYAIVIKDAPRPSRYFVKANDIPEAFEMFQAEVLGLELLEKSSVIRVPKVLSTVAYNSGAALVMEYISEGSPSKYSWEKFGSGLAAIHRSSSQQFGLPTHNFIGKLAQINTPAGDWPEFYLENRILPQVKLARDSNLLSISDHSAIQKSLTQIQQLLPNEKPSLLHGDLWNGNFLWSSSGAPVLIDPASYYGHREVDLAMSLLFGGFPNQFYDSYQAAYPLIPDWKTRIPIYQLYYLLVHLNLFGRSYHSATMNIFKGFS